MQRDSIDFGSMKVGQLFCKQLFPTLLGMVFSALFVITDGVFVGRGIGSDALAAVNIAAPLFVFAAGMGLMFGMGGAIVASINLARGKERVANINATQATLVSFIGMTLVSILVMAFPTSVARILGAPEDIIELAREYLIAYAAFAMFQTALCVLTFFTRIDGPKIAMWCMTISTVINIILDYLFIFVYKWGLTGAAVATGIGEIVGCILMVAYLLRYSPRVRLGKLKFSWKSIQLTARNSGYIIRLGFSAFLGEAAIGVMMLTGNYVFVSYLGSIQYHVLLFPDHIYGFQCHYPIGTTHYQFQPRVCSTRTCATSTPAGIDCNNCNRLVFLGPHDFTTGTNRIPVHCGPHKLCLEVCRIWNSLFLDMLCFLRNQHHHYRVLHEYRKVTTINDIYRFKRNHITRNLFLPPAIMVRSQRDLASSSRGRIYHVCRDLYKCNV